MLCERDRRYYERLEEQVGVDVILERYQVADPVDALYGYGHLPIDVWAVGQDWGIAEDEPAPARPARYDVLSDRRAELARLRERYARWPNEDLMERITSLSYALGEEEIA